MNTSDKPRILVVLERLNEARYMGATALAAELEEELDALDKRVGYRRGRPRVARHLSPTERHERRRD